MLRTTTRTIAHRIEVTLAAGACLAALLACNVSASTGSEVKARVDCVGSHDQPVIECDVEHVEGSSGANVCWDLHYQCANGSVVTGSGICQSVQPGSTAQKVVPVTQLSNSAACDNATSSEVRNLRISTL